jgi:hypothetical protein
MVCKEETIPPEDTAEWSIVYEFLVIKISDTSRVKRNIKHGVPPRIEVWYTTSSPCSTEPPPVYKRMSIHAHIM